MHGVAGYPGDGRMADDGLLEAVRGLHLTHPELGPKPLLTKLRQQQPDLAAGNKEVREALAALKAEESKPTEAAATPPAAAAPPRSAEERGAPPDVAISLACFGCGRLPSEMGDGREKHPVCPKCRELKIPTTYWCDVNCPGNPAAWKRHAPVHKAVKKQRERNEDGGVLQQRDREVAERQARHAAQTGDAYDELLAEGARYSSQQDTRRAARAFREAIALRPDRARGVLQPRCSARQLGARRGGRAAVPRGQGALPGGLGGLGRGHGSGLRHAEAGGVRRGGQAGVVERRGAQGAVGEGGEGGAGRSGSQPDAG